jgi:hypothetical protein
MSRPRSLALVLLLAAASLGGPPASAATLSPIADCQAHAGVLTENYSTRQLQQALSQMSVSVREYTTCYTAISNELNLRLGHVGKPIGDSGGVRAGSGGSGTTVIAVILAVIVLAGVANAAWAARRRRAR